MRRDLASRRLSEVAHAVLELIGITQATLPADWGLIASRAGFLTLLLLASAAFATCAFRHSFCSSAAGSRWCPEQSRDPVGEARCG